MPAQQDGFSFCGECGTLGLQADANTILPIARHWATLCRRCLCNYMHIAYMAIRVFRAEADHDVVLIRVVFEVKKCNGKSA